MMLILSSNALEVQPHKFPSALSHLQPDFTLIMYQERVSSIP